MGLKSTKIDQNLDLMTQLSLLKISKTTKTHLHSFRMVFMSPKIKIYALVRYISEYIHPD